MVCDKPSGQDLASRLPRCKMNPPVHYLLSSNLSFTVSILRSAHSSNLNFCCLIALCFLILSSFVPVFGEQSSATNMCSKCNRGNQQTFAIKMVEEIKESLLLKLGFPNGPPDMTNIHVHQLPQALLDRYKVNIKHPPDLKYSQQKGKENPIRHKYDDDEAIKTKGLVARAKEDIKSARLSHHTPVPPLVFTFDHHSKVTVLRATLWLFRKSISRPNQTVQLALLKPIAQDSWQEFKVIKYNHKDLSGNKGEWLSINLTNESGSILKNDSSSPLQWRIIVHPTYYPSFPSGDGPFITELKKCDRKSNNSVDDCEYNPYLELEIEEHHHSRKKRDSLIDSEDCSMEDKVATCCRYPLVVNFTALDFKFVIAPDYYTAYMCVGDCEYLSKNKYPHTQLMELAQAQNGQNTTRGKPCCGARSLSALPMLYFNENGNIVYSLLPGMVVERCGCI